jgi:predicted AlkP superfamily phosphohydrolase/phosphomutase
MGRVIVLGLDGGCSELLEILIDKGSMPNLKELVKSSSFGFLRSTNPPVTAPSWISMATGVNPGKHGCYDFNKPTTSLQKVKPIQSWDIKVKTFYELLKESGKKCILVNLPGTFPPLTDFITLTSLLTQGENSVFPERLKEESEAFKNYRIFPDTSLLRKGELKKYLQDVYDVELKRYQCLKKLWEKEWDCLFYVFSGGDWVSHEFYTQLIEDKAPVEALKVFQLFDEILYFVLNKKQEEDNLIIISDHGFKKAKGVLHINEILHKNKLLNPDFQNPSPPMSHKMEENLFSVSEFKKVNPKILESVLKSKGLKKIVKALRKFGYKYPLFLKVDPKSSFCLMLTSESYGITINDKRRFEDGIVSSDEFDKTRNKIKEILDSLKYNEEKVFRDLFFKEEVYNGEHLDIAPDIVFGDSDWAYSSGIRTLQDNPFAICERGIHSQYGIFLCNGRNVKNVRLEKGKISVVDIAPLILFLLGEKIPNNFDGKILKEMFEDDYLIKNKVEFCEYTLPQREEKEIDSEEIAKRLKSLGYMQ